MDSNQIQRQFHYDVSQLHQQPNANTSGLPAPRQRLSSEQSSPEKQQVVSPIPSTVGSAIRRHLADAESGSGLVAKPAPIGSRLPTPGAYGSPCESNQSSFCVRRSQSQRPSFGAKFGPSNRYNGQCITFAAHLKTNSPRSNSAKNNGVTNDEPDPDNEELDKCIESLPPLKSTTYISKLISSSNGRKESSLEPMSEPIAGSDRNKKQAQSQGSPTKPSQLVKPILNKNSQCKRSSTSKSLAGIQVKSSNAEADSASNLEKENANLSQSRFGSASTGKSQLPVGRSPSFAATSSFRRPSQTATPETNGIPSSFIASPGRKPSTNDHKSNSDRGKRLSLQHSGYNSLSLQLNNSSRTKTSDEDQSEVSAESSDETEENGDFEDSEGPEEAMSEDEDDATTATTMTQMSDSNMMLESANQELNSMIQMLSSNAILGDRMNRCDKDPNSESSTSYENDPKFQATNQESTSTNIAGLPKVKSKLIKSQSLSFNQRAIESRRKGSNESSQLSGRSLIYQDLKRPSILRQKSGLLADNSKESFQSSSTVSSGSLSTSTTSSSESTDQKQVQQGVHNKIKLARPRSRIIFDPTNNQFHVSCNDSLEDRFCDDVATSNLDDGDDEASIKLLDTQDRIGALKCLPRLEGNNFTTGKNEAEHEEDESETIKRLKDCRGSLQSLIMSSQRNLDPDKHRGEESTPSNSLTSGQADSARHRKSPVGAALRSLFGIQSSAGSRNTSSSGEKKASKVATIVRHGSLKCNVRSNYQNKPEVTERKISLQNECSPHHEKAPASAVKHTNLGSDLLYRAGKKLSASSSSLTSKFKSISLTVPSQATSKNRASYEEPGRGNQLSTDGRAYDISTDCQQKADRSIENGGVRISRANKPQLKVSTKSVTLFSIYSPPNYVDHNWISAVCNCERGIPSQQAGCCGGETLRLDI